MNMSADFEPIRRETDSQTRAIERVADQVHRLNDAIIRAVNEGISVELVRVSRHHGGNGCWGDQVVPTIREAQRGDTDRAATQPAA